MGEKKPEMRLLRTRISENWIKVSPKYWRIIRISASITMAGQ
jgi:hypothetical protein